jgi:hypothetical protein
VALGHHGFEEVVVHFDGTDGRVALPFATVTERATDARIEEVRVYHGTRSLTGRRAGRRPAVGRRSAPSCLGCRPLPPDRRRGCEGAR